jgi:beta-phosphoglucomutase family hydrolase
MIGVIFDIDGVLVDSGKAHFNAWVRLGNEIGVPINKKVLKRTFGMHGHYIIKEWLGDNLPKQKIIRLADKKEAIFRSMVDNCVKPIAGSVKLIRELHNAGIKLAVASSGPRKNVEKILRFLKVEKYFPVRITGDDVTKGKPDPEVFIKAVKRLKLKPSQCVVIEDAPLGILAAKNAGVKVIGITTCWKRMDLISADLVIGSFTASTLKQLYNLISHK